MIEDIQNKIKAARILLKNDDKNKVFVNHPWYLQVAEKDFENWSKSFIQEVLDLKYHASPAIPIDIPKPSWHVRPGMILSLEDHFIFQLIGISIREKIKSSMEWSAKNIRCAHILSENSNQWFNESIKGWGSFRSKTVEYLESNFSHVLETDISGYYENIDIMRLCGDLTYIGIQPEISSLLNQLLTKWSGLRRRGIPQGYSPSDMLGAFYLNSVDQRLNSEGYTHLRYNDDFRVFVNSEAEARRALHRLSTLLRERGLNLQTAKTKILPAESAIESYNEIDTVIRNISSELIKELKESEEISDYFIPTSWIHLAKTSKSDIPPEVLIRAWDEFIHSANIKFNKTIFHFLLNRVADLNLDITIDYCLECLLTRPEEILFILNHLSRISKFLNTKTLDAVANILTDKETLFKYQKHTVLRWFTENGFRNDKVRSYCREIIRNGPIDHTIRPYAIAYISLYAELFDFEDLEAVYVKSHDNLDRLSIVCAFKNAPKGVRNTFYSRIKDDDVLIARAINWSKNA